MTNLWPRAILVNLVPWGAASDAAGDVGSDIGPLPTLRRLTKIRLQDRLVCIRPQRLRGTAAYHGAGSCSARHRRPLFSGCWPPTRRLMPGDIPRGLAAYLGALALGHRGAV